MAAQTIPTVAPAGESCPFGRKIADQLARARDLIANAPAVRVQP